MKDWGKMIPGYNNIEREKRKFEKEVEDDLLSIGAYMIRSCVLTSSKYIIIEDKNVIEQYFTLNGSNISECRKFVNKLYQENVKPQLYNHLIKRGYEVDLFNDSIRIKSIIY